jgi:hypothetical protein
MDKVEVIFLPCPGLDRIVNFEADIRGDPLGLARGEVCANYFRAGVSIGEFTKVCKQAVYTDMFGCRT